MVIFKNLDNPLTTEFEQLLKNQLSKIQNLYKTVLKYFQLKDEQFLDCCVWT